MEENKIKIKIRGQDGDEVYFLVSRDAPLRKLFNTYCTKKGLAEGSVRFFIDGDRVRPEQTPKELELEEGDMIDCQQHQVGGV